MPVTPVQWAPFVGDQTLVTSRNITIPSVTAGNTLALAILQFTPNRTVSIADDKFNSWDGLSGISPVAPVAWTSGFAVLLARVISAASGTTVITVTVDGGLQASLILGCQELNNVNGVANLNSHEDASSTSHACASSFTLGDGYIFAVARLANWTNSMAAGTDFTTIENYDSQSAGAGSFDVLAMYHNNAAITTTGPYTSDLSRIGYGALVEFPSAVTVSNPYLLVKN